MKKLILLILFIGNISLSYSQCPTPTGLYVTNISHNVATANWNSVSGADHYRIRTREIGTTSWINLLNIDSTMNSRLIPLLQPATTYEWKIEAYCDSSNQLNSNWSLVDTFTTNLFVAAPFNPIIINSPSNLQCNNPTNLVLSVSQNANEPDIQTSQITSDGGYFNIGALMQGDSVGFANLITTLNNVSITISLTLKVGLITSQNYATINAFDSTSSIVGFFTIENITNGIKVTTSSPNDGNNYTSAYTSNLHFNNIFINPPSAGPLNFYANITSELGDQFNDTSSVQIWCNTSTLEQDITSSKLLKIVDAQGKDCNAVENKLLLYIYDDGRVIKRININN